MLRSMIHECPVKLLLNFSVYDHKNYQMKQDTSVGDWRKLHEALILSENFQAQLIAKNY